MTLDLIDNWTDTLRLLVEQAVPERKDELCDLLTRYHPPLLEVPDKSGVTLEADRNGIYFARKDLQLLWLLGFSAWRAIELYAPSIVVAEIQDRTVVGVLAQDPDGQELERDYFERLRAVDALVKTRVTDIAHWPADIPLPVETRDDLKTEQDRLMFDIVMLATAAMLFHEIRHVMFRADEDGPAERYEEEARCDVWARDMLTAKLAVYAKATNVDFDKVLRKRSYGLMLAGLYLNIVTPMWERGGSKDYPPLSARLASLIDTSAFYDDDNFWVFTASVLLAEARRTHIDLSTIGDGLAPKALAGALLSVMHPERSDDA